MRPMSTLWSASIEPTPTLKSGVQWIIGIEIFQCLQPGQEPTPIAQVRFQYRRRSKQTTKRDYKQQLDVEYVMERKG
jgi:hypothetical protein